MGRTKASTKINPLDSWHTLQATIHSLTEKELDSLIEKELKGKGRYNMVMRMFMKKNKIRYSRERDALTKRCKPNGGGKLFA